MKGGMQMKVLLCLIAAIVVALGLAFVREMDR